MLAPYLQRSAAVIAGCSAIEGEVERAIAIIVEAARARLPILVCGNGGSAADAMHIAGELVGRYLKDRLPIGAIALTDPVIGTAWSNDAGFVDIFARQVAAHGRKGAVLIALTTSGTSPNVLSAITMALDLGMTVIAFTGERGATVGLGRGHVVLKAPATETPMIQQAHQCMYHYICGRVEDALTTGG